MNMTGWLAGTAVIVVIFAVAAVFWFRAHGFP
jgi:hypothetical protein